ncbi:serine hydrolase domain-containing protein [Henriciella litoralis]|uniref:serine hydrolase domain-containing protein n=1 Tax=Henriciella litoralis TaxID=568102 RepID=UPI00146E2091|nr:serine hydrolase domain-containing protein [Henriciella litoralis]
MSRTILRSTTILSCAASLAIFVAACAAAPTATDSAGVSESWPPLATEDAADFDAAGLEELASAMQGFVDAGQVIGMQTLLVKDGEVAQYGEYGVRDVETATPVQPGTIYRIYSMSKPITGVALMQLYEQGKFSLDDPITKFIPEFENLKVLDGENEDGTPILVDLERPATMRELMSHTAGFAYGLGGTDYANNQFRDQEVLRAPDFDTFIDKVAGIPLLYQPGEKWYYSAAVDIQGYLVEKLSGMPFGEYLDANVLTPLNMDDTGFFVPEADYDRLADVTTYYEEAGKFVPFYTENVQFKESTVPFESGGGGLVSTIDDYARFSQMMLNGGSLSGQQILKPETVALMTQNQLPDDVVGIGFDGTNANLQAGEPHKFGLDFGIITDPAAMKSPAGTGTYYWGGAAGTWFWIDPENDLFFIGMIQRFGQLPDEPADFRTDSMRLIYEALEE